MATCDEALDRIHTEVAQAGDGFITDSLAARGVVGGELQVTLWLDAPHPSVALGTALNILDRALNRALVGSAATRGIYIRSVECEMIDLIPVDLPWPVLEHEPEIRLTEEV